VSLHGLAVPADLCPVHRQLALEWRNNDYLPHRPEEWPGGLSACGGFGLMDSRTSHEEREVEFDRKNAGQVDLIVRICRSGTSPQCGPLATDLPEAATPEGTP